MRWTAVLLPAPMPPPKKMARGGKSGVGSQRRDTMHHGQCPNLGTHPPPPVSLARAMLGYTGRGLNDNRGHVRLHGPRAQ